MSSLVMERRAKQIMASRLRTVTRRDNISQLGDDLPTGIRRFVSKREFLASVREAMNKADAE